ncbi:MAG: pilus assembly protein TadG-related protein [Dehalococcoidia bacterium]
MQLEQQDEGVIPAVSNREMLRRRAVHSAHELSRARSDERGQMAITMVLSLVVVVIFFSLAFDAGTTRYFDHRNAQNEADAAALAAAGITRRQHHDRDEGGRGGVPVAQQERAPLRVAGLPAHRKRGLRPPAPAVVSA